MCGVGERFAFLKNKMKNELNWGKRRVEPFKGLN